MIGVYTVGTRGRFPLDRRVGLMARLMFLRVGRQVLLRCLGGPHDVRIMPACVVNVGVVVLVVEVPRHEAHRRR